MDTQVVGVSVDHVPALKAWAESIGGVDYPLASDFWPHGEAARVWGVLREDDGYTERAIFVVDRKGVVRYADVHDIDDQPPIEDLFAVLKDLEPHLALRSRVKALSAERQAEEGVAEEAAEPPAAEEEVAAEESMADVEAVAEALDTEEPAAEEEPAEDTSALGEADELELEPAEGEPDVEEEPSAEEEEAPAEAEEPAAAEDEPALLMYCTPWCPDCKQAREWLDKHSIPYREVDVSRDLGARTRAAGYNEGRLHTPTFELEGDICVDFKPDRLSELLGMSK